MYKLGKICIFNLCIYGICSDLIFGFKCKCDVIYIGILCDIGKLYLKC